MFINVFGSQWVNIKLDLHFFFLCVIWSFENASKIPMSIINVSFYFIFVHRKFLIFGARYFYFLLIAFVALYWLPAYYCQPRGVKMRKCVLKCGRDEFHDDTAYRKWPQRLIHTGRDWTPMVKLSPCCYVFCLTNTTWNASRSRDVPTSSNTCLSQTSFSQVAYLVF